MAVKIQTKFHTEDMTVLYQTSVRETYPLHTHENFEFFLVSKGRALHLVNKTAQIVEAGSLVLVRPQDEHCYDYYLTQDFEFYNVGFSPTFFNLADQLYEGALVPLAGLPLPVQISLPEEKRLSLIERLEELRGMERGPAKRLLRNRIIADTLYLFLENRRQEKALPDWLVALLDQIAKPEHFTAGLSDLLKMANYSQEHVNREFQRYLHTKPTRYINELRMRYAYGLLISTEDPIVEICARSGFGNLGHFYEQFRRFYGFSPGAARRKQHSSGTPST